MMHFRQAFRQMHLPKCQLNNAITQNGPEAKNFGAVLSKG